MIRLIEAAPDRVAVVARTTDRYLLFPLLTPAVLLAASNDAFGFDVAGYLDSFVYVGYFWHYPEHLWVFDDNSNYKISRLPWILPGYVIHALTGPILASFALAYLSIVIGSVALYLLVRDGLDSRGSAAITSVAWACCTWAHGNGGWNYQVLVATGYYLMACWLVVRAARGPSPRSAALAAGVFFAAASHTHLFLVTFAPLLAALHVAALPPENRSRIYRSALAALLVIAGGVGLTVVLAAVNGITGGAWLFFMPQIEQAMKVTDPAYDHWWKGNASLWLPAAYYLVIPLALMMAGLMALFRHRGAPERRLSLTLVALAWAAFGIMCYFQFARRLTTLDYGYVAFVLYPHAFACLGVVLSQAMREARRPALLVGVVSALILGTLLLLLPSPLPQMMNALSQSLGLLKWAPPVAPMAVCLLGVVTMLLVRGSSRVLLFAVWFAIVNAWIAPVPLAYGIGTPGYQQSMLRLFREADRVTTAIDPTLIGIKYWMSSEVVTTPTGEVLSSSVFNSFVATRAWFTNLLGRTSPSPPIEKLTLADLDRGTCIGILSSPHSQPTLQREMEAHFASLGRPLEAVAVQRFEDANLSFALAVLKPLSSADLAGPPCAR
jgi:hypothetical protein